MVLRPEHCLQNRWFHFWVDPLDGCEEIRIPFASLGEARVHFQHAAEGIGKPLPVPRRRGGPTMAKKPGLLHGRLLTTFRRDSFQSVAAHCATTNATVFPDLGLEKPYPRQTTDYPTPEEQRFSCPECFFLEFDHSEREVKKSSHWAGVGVSVLLF